MSKELEALKIGIPKLKKLYENNAKKMSQNDILGFDLVFVYLDKALQRLESIDNADLSEALKCLEVLEDCASVCGDYSHRVDSIKQALIKAQEQEKVLEIIKEKEVDTFMLMLCDNVEQYNSGLKNKPNRQLTQEEFELLKEWLR